MDSVAAMMQMYATNQVALLNTSDRAERFSGAMRAALSADTTHYVAWPQHDALPKAGPVRRVTETVARQWEILTLIPREPLSITTAEIRARLADRGHHVDVRTVQRDLVALESHFMLMCRTEGRTNSWFWNRNQVPLQSPAMSAVTAVTLLLVRDYLLPLLPSAVLEELRPYFVKASEQLEGTKLSPWADRVRVLERGPVLGSPPIDASVRDVVYAAVLEGRLVELDYRDGEGATDRRSTVVPFGLVIKDGILYLVATAGNSDDIERLALHRIRRARLLQATGNVPVTLSLREYVEGDRGFGQPTAPDRIELEAIFESGAARDLLERTPAPGEYFSKTPDGRLRLETRVEDTAELRRWLLGFGNRVEVVRPRALRKELAEAAVAMARRYGADDRELVGASEGVRSCADEQT